MTAAHSVQFPTQETIREMGTSFRRNHFWDRLGGQALVMIGWWYSRQPLTNHMDCLSIKQSQKSPVGAPPYAQRRQMHVGCFLRQSVCYGFAERKWKKMAGNVKESSPKMAFAAIKTNQKWWSPWITNTKKKTWENFCNSFKRNALILSVVGIIIVIFIIILEYNSRNLLKKNYLEGASTHFSTHVRTPYGMTHRSRRCVTKRLQCWE